MEIGVAILHLLGTLEKYSAVFGEKLLVSRLRICLYRFPLLDFTDFGATKSS